MSSDRLGKSLPVLNEQMHQSSTGPQSQCASSSCCRKRCDAISNSIVPLTSAFIQHSQRELDSFRKVTVWLRHGNGSKYFIWSDQHAVKIVQMYKYTDRKGQRGYGLFATTPRPSVSLIPAGERRDETFLTGNIKKNQRVSLICPSARVTLTGVNSDDGRPPVCDLYFSAADETNIYLFSTRRVWPQEGSRIKLPSICNVMWSVCWTYVLKNIAAGDKMEKWKMYRGHR